MIYRFLLALTLFLAAAPSQAEPKELNISVGEWPPYLSAELKHHGVIAHLISDIFADEGYHVSFRFLPWPRAYSAAARGKYDGTAVWMHKAEREADFLYSAPLLNEQFVFFHLKSMPLDWRSFADLQGMKLGGGIGYSYGAEFDTFLLKNTVRMERVSTTEQNFGKLLKERIQIFPQEMNVGYADLRNHFSHAEREKVTHHPHVFLNNLSYLLLPKHLASSPALLEQFNRRLQSYRDSGRYDQYFIDLQQGKYLPDAAP